MFKTILGLTAFPFILFFTCFSPIAGAKEIPKNLSGESKRLSNKPGKLPVFVGTYTDESSRGIYLLYLDPETGALESSGLAGEVKNPSFLAIHPNRMLLYAVSEVSSSSGRPGGTINAFKIDPECGKLTFINRESSRGMGPCHLIVDNSGKWVLAANYGSGSIACLPVRADGGVGKAVSFVQHKGSSINPRRQKGAHAHEIILDPANRFAFVPDLGMDKIMVYKFDSNTGKLVPNQPGSVKIEPGSGPRHLSFHPNGRFAYVINEMKSSITGFKYDPELGVLTPFQRISTLPKDFKGSSTSAEIEVHPSGRFLYGSNRGHNSIAIFHINTKTGKLTNRGYKSTGGKTPRNFEIDPSGRFLLAANQDSDNIVVFRINRKTGKLQQAGSPLHISKPVCVKIMAPR